MLCSYEIILAARPSLLSQIQAQEVASSLRLSHPNLTIHFLFVATQGDLDKQTSLRALEKTDFFTKEVDELLLKGHCDGGVHSAKDLPDPLKKGLYVAKITPSIDSRDSLVCKYPLPEAPLIATSSVRREDNVLKVFPKARFTDIRGTIQERLAQWEKGLVDGVVIAEAALIRLQLTHLNRLYLPGETAPLQGSLAIVIREDDVRMKKLFQSESSSVIWGRGRAGGRAGG